MNFFSWKRTPEVLLLVALAMAGLTRAWDSPWDRTIRSDGKGYYAYLPAIILHQDPSYAFEASYENRYYHHETSAPNYFKQSANNRVVNKYFPGLALLLLPFFLIAHALALISGAEADGYSPIYQAAVAIAALTYFWLGLRLMWQLLHQLKIPPARSAAVLTALALGSNLFFYTIYGAGFSHVYSFFLISAFLAAVAKLPEKKGWWGACLAFGLIVIVRPVNALVLLAVPLVWGNWKQVGQGLLQPFSRWMGGLLLVVSIFALVPLLWYWQCGQWVVDSYAGEGFDFRHPHWWEFLVSYRKGWFTYTPMAILAMGGLGYLASTNRFRLVFALLFYGSIVWLFSSWSSWWYGGSFGQRPMVEFTPILALLLAWSFTGLAQLKWQKYLVTLMAMAFIGLNQLQIWQYRQYILPNDETTAEQYWQVFGSLTRTARVDIPNTAIASRKPHFLLWSETGKHPNVLPTENTKTGFAAHLIGEESYTPGLDVRLAKGQEMSANVAVINTRVYSNDWLTKAVLVTSVHNKEGKTLQYHQFELASVVPWREWREVDFKIDLPADAASLKTYGWNPSKEGHTVFEYLKVQVLAWPASSQ